MKNFHKSGKIITLTAPGGGVVSGTGYVIGRLFVVATATVAAGLPFEALVEGVVTLPKVAGVWAEGDKLFWSAGDAKVTTDSAMGANLPIGEAAASALDAATSGKVRLDGAATAALDGVQVFHIRKRFTVAQVNAGASLLAAIPKRKIRMIDVQAIAIGGAVGTTTTVDVLGTQGAAGVKLAAFAQANLTENTVLRPGIAGCAVLAAAASFGACDVNTAVTVGKTGGAADTATHVEISFTYALDAG